MNWTFFRLPKCSVLFDLSLHFFSFLFVSFLLLVLSLLLPSYFFSLQPFPYLFYILFSFQSTLLFTAILFFSLKPFPFFLCISLF